ncbi:hypothetical protein BH23PAT1_BH23PAT1_4180 [soil metagenome]
MAIDHSTIPKVPAWTEPGKEAFLQLATEVPIVLAVPPVPEGVPQTTNLVTETEPPDTITVPAPPPYNETTKNDLLALPAPPMEPESTALTLQEAWRGLSAKRKRIAIGVGTAVLGIATAVALAMGPGGSSDSETIEDSAEAGAAQLYASDSANREGVSSEVGATPGSPETDRPDTAKSEITEVSSLPEYYNFYQDRAVERISYELNYDHTGYDEVRKPSERFHYGQWRGAIIKEIEMPDNQVVFLRLDNPELFWLYEDQIHWVANLSLNGELTGELYTSRTGSAEITTSSGGEESIRFMHTDIGEAWSFVDDVNSGQYVGSRVESFQGSVLVARDLYAGCSRDDTLPLSTPTARVFREREDALAGLDQVIDFFDAEQSGKDHNRIEEIGC